MSTCPSVVSSPTAPRIHHAPHDLVRTWGRLIVRLDGHNPAASALYFQHTCDAEMHRWDQKQSRDYRTEQTRPVAYSAHGSHTSYPAPIVVGAEGSCDKTLPEGYDDVAADGGDWYGFGGARGEVSAVTVTGDLFRAEPTGPVGPPCKDSGSGGARWRHRTSAASR